MTLMPFVLRSHLTTHFISEFLWYLKPIFSNNIYFHVSHLIHKIASTCKIKLGFKVSHLMYLSLGHLQGLLGNYNGIVDDDFLPRSGSRLLSTASERQLHYDFGMTCKYICLYAMYILCICYCPYCCNTCYDLW